MCRFSIVWFYTFCWGLMSAVFTANSCICSYCLVSYIKSVMVFMYERNTYSSYEYMYIIFMCSIHRRFPLHIRVGTIAASDIYKRKGNDP
jgi:hypothetical protein